MILPSVELRRNKTKHFSKFDFESQVIFIHFYWWNKSNNRRIRIWSSISASLYQKTPISLSLQFCRSKNALREGRRTTADSQLKYGGKEARQIVSMWTIEKQQMITEMQIVRITDHRFFSEKSISKIFTLTFEGIYHRKLRTCAIETIIRNRNFSSSTSTPFQEPFDSDFMVTWLFLDFSSPFFSKHHLIIHQHG